MAFELGQAVKATFVAAEDLSTAQYKFVELAQTGAFPEGGLFVASSAQSVIGVLQNAPKAGQEAEVVLVGITKVKTSQYGNITVGGRVTLQAVATGPAGAVTDTGNGWILGRALTSANGGEIATIAISTPAANYFVD